MQATKLAGYTKLESMKETRCTVESAEAVGTITHEKNLAEEMMELRKLCTAVMMEKCLGKSKGVLCPKPRKRHYRGSGEHVDNQVAAQLSDSLVSKGSPPYYSGSPPMRTSNPLIRDAHFRQQRMSKGKITASDGSDNTNWKFRTRSALMKA